MEGETPLLLACMHQDSTEVVRVLLEHGAGVDLGNNENHTPLHEGTAGFPLSCNNLIFLVPESQSKKAGNLYFRLTYSNFNIVNTALLYSF
jgi:ankyrin repeat protein